MTVSVVTVVFVLILFTLGYQFDRKAGTLEQGGLVQFDSIPSGATLTIDSARLSATTATKTTLSPGSHTITMSREGYKNWQKAVDVHGGDVLWLRYARLIPDSLTVEDVASLPGITSSMVAPNREKYALTTEATSPTIQLAAINSDNPEILTLKLPENSYTKAQDKETERFILRSWDPSSRYLLLEHRYDGLLELLVVDTDNMKNTKNMTAIFGVEIQKPKFSLDNSRILYGVVNGNLRRINLSDETISASLVPNVDEFSFAGDSIILYVTKLNETTKSRSVGYRHENASKSRTLRTYSDDGSVPLHIALGEYYHKKYIGIAYDTTVEILAGSLPRSDSGDSLSLETITAMSTPEPITYLSNKTSGRFFVAQHANKYSVYDLELQKTTTTTLRGDGELKSELHWLDGYIVWSNLGGVLRFYEFDGANQNDIMPIVQGQRPALTSNNRYIYAPTQDKNGVFHLSRVRLVL